MITYHHDDLLADPAADALVVPVNTYGIMGAGLALQAARRWPGVALRFRNEMQKKRMRPGEARVYQPKEQRAELVLLATKDHWQDAAQLGWIDAGVRWLFAHYLDRDATLALPALGCGLGGLSWEDVLPRLERLDQLELVNVRQPKIAYDPAEYLVRPTGNRLTLRVYLPHEARPTGKAKR